MTNPSTAIIGAAGEHLVMSRLLARGYTAGLAPQGAPNIDILVSSKDGSTLKSVQVKTSRSPKSWILSKKHEGIFSENLYYCLVYLDEKTPNQSEVYVLHSSLVAKLVRVSHKKWLAGSKVRGSGPRTDTDRRAIQRDFTNLFGEKTEYREGWLNAYKEAWDQFKN